MSHEPDPLKFAYWVPNVSGGLVVSKIEQRTSWDIDYNRRLARIAEQNGFDYALSQIRFTAGYGAEYQHESVAFSHALLAATERLKVIAAILPGPWHPAVVAKQLATIDQLNQGRVAINVVSGWFKGEFTAIGEPWLEHDERYRRSEEFIRAVKGVWTQDSFTFKGDFYRFNDYTLKPKPLQQPHPEVFQGGNSAAARRMAAAVSDWYFMNGNTLDGHRAQIDEIRAAAAAQGRRVKFGVNAHVREPVRLKRQMVDLGGRQAVRVPRDRQEAEHTARCPARLRDADCEPVIARVAPQRRRIVRARLRPDDHVRAERAVAHGRIDLQVVHFLIALHPAVRIGVEDRDDRLRDRQRHTCARRA